MLPEDVAEALAPAPVLAAGPDTIKLSPHFRHLIRAPTKLGGILPRSPQVGQVTYGIVPTSFPTASAISIGN
jgi:hypothetical protein